MKGQKGVEGLFYDFSSDTRLAILRVLRSEDLRMQETARRLDLTGTEASRQLQRLTDSQLIRRQPDGSYTLTEFGKLSLHLSSSLEFIYLHREYFETHDIWGLPLQFVNRLGELSQATLGANPMDNMSRAERIIREAEGRFWGIGEGFFTEGMGAASEEGIRRGVEWRVLSPLQAVKEGGLENRTFLDSPVVIFLTEKEAFVGLRLHDGRIDYTGFFGSDPGFLGWVGDLFLHLWGLGKTNSPSRSIP